LAALEQAVKKKIRAQTEQSRRRDSSSDGDNQFDYARALP